MELARLSLVVIALAGVGRAACPPSCPLPGGGAPQHDCHAEFASTALRLNYPPLDPARPRPRREVRCFDGEVGCDADGLTNGACAFPIDVCLLHDADPNLSSCVPATVTRIAVSGSSHSADLQALDAALQALLPGASGGN